MPSSALTQLWAPSLLGLRPRLPRGLPPFQGWVTERPQTPATWRKVSLQTELHRAKRTGLMLKKAQAGINTGTTEGRKGRKPRGGRPQATELLHPTPQTALSSPRHNRLPWQEGYPGAEDLGCQTRKSLTEVSGSREDHLALSPSQGKEARSPGDAVLRNHQPEEPQPD